MTSRKTDLFASFTRQTYFSRRTLDGAMRMRVYRSIEKISEEFFFTVTFIVDNLSNQWLENIFVKNERFYVN